MKLQEYYNTVPDSMQNEQVSLKGVRRATRGQLIPYSATNLFPPGRYQNGHPHIPVSTHGALFSPRAFAEDT